jgi:hypothetical protein
MRFPQGLTRHLIRRRVNHAEWLTIERQAHEAHVSVANFIRVRLGLPERNTGRPSREDLEREQDEAWKLLKEGGYDPAGFFPEDESWMDEYATENDENE